MSTTPKTTAPLALTRLSTSLIAYCLLAVSLAFIALHLFVYQNQQHMEQQRAEFITEILSLKLAKPVAMSNNRELISVAQNQLHDTHINKLCIYDATGNLIPLYENSLVNRQCPINTVRTPLARQKGWHHRPLILNTNTLGTIWVYTPRQPWLEWVTTQFGIIGLFFGLLIIIALWMHYHLNMLIIAPLKAISTHLETADIDQDVTIPKQLVARHPLGGFTQVLHDRITAINTHNDQLKEIAFNDPLTGLPNRRHFWEHLTVSVHRLKRTHKPIAVLLVDLDGFKAVNDRLGHEIGDALLTEVARTMRTCLRQEDFLARLGGDEFTLVLRDCDDPVVPKRIAQKILHALDRTFTIEGEDIRIGASIGIAMAPFDGRETHELTRMADKAMYLAKRRGKSRFAFWSESLNQFSDNLAHDESIILQAIEHNALNLQLVPQHDFSAQRSIVGIEAVTTLRHDASMPHLSRSVEEVIMQSDNAKLLLRYHSWLFKEISTLISRWKANPRYHKTLLPLTVQLAPHKLQLTCFVHAYKEALRRNLINPKDVMIQMHEQTLNRLHHLPLNSLEDPLNQCFFSQLQVALTVDDLPDAYTILNKAPNALVKRLHFSSLRYESKYLTSTDDNSIENMNTIDHDAFTNEFTAATQAVFAFAHRFNCEIAISHIDQASTWHLFKQLGATIGQGGYLSQSGNAQNIESLIDEHTTARVD